MAALIIRSLIGWMTKGNYSKGDNVLSLITLIATHTQVLLGVLLYIFASPFVKFNSETMSDKATRYWTVEHITMMIIAVALITAARSTSKKMTDPVAKHRRQFLFNAIAVAIILVAIQMSGRGFI